MRVFLNVGQLLKQRWLEGLQTVGSLSKYKSKATCKRAQQLPTMLGVVGQQCCVRLHGAKHPRRPRGSQSGREKKLNERFQVRAKEPLGTDSCRTVSKNSSGCRLLIGQKKCFVLLCPIGEQFLLSSFRVFEHDGYCLATLARFVHQACAYKGNFYFLLS